MAQTNMVDIVKEVAIKQKDGTAGNFEKFGGTFETVVDARGNEHYSLAQFFDNYQAFLNAAKFIYVGTEKPTNHKNMLWIDTGHTNQDNQ